jgi:hypothetical protein
MVTVLQFRCRGFVFVMEEEVVGGWFLDVG